MVCTATTEGVVEKRVVGLTCLCGGASKVNNNGSTTRTHKGEAKLFNSTYKKYYYNKCDLRSLRSESVFVKLRCLLNESVFVNLRSQRSLRRLSSLIILNTLRNAMSSVLYLFKTNFRRYQPHSQANIDCADTLKILR